MARTTEIRGRGIHWERPERRPRTVPASRVSEAQERPTFLSLFLPLAALAIGSILAVGVIAAVLVGLVTLLI